MSTDLYRAGGYSPRTTPRCDALRVCDRCGLTALVLYLALSIVFFARGLVGQFCTAYIGIGTDPALMTWFLVWWPHAIANHLNPFLTYAIWSPSGTNLAWQTSLPLASVLATPITVTLGPIAAFNTLCLLSLPLDAWSAFILCSYVARRYWASFLGGYIFGFSAFMLGQLTAGHLHMVLVFPIPLAVYLVVRRLAADIAESRFMLLFVLLMVTQFLLSIEIFATMSMFGTIALVLGWSYGSVEIRKRIPTLLKLIARSYVCALIVVSPFFYYLFGFGFKAKPIFPPAFYSADLLNFVIPTRVNEIGRIALFQSISRRFFNGWLAEAGACFSLPLILVAAGHTVRRWHPPQGRFLFYCLIITIVFSLGPFLHIASRRFPIALPWLPFVQLPVINNALPVRFSMYACLVLALIVSLWLADDSVRPAVRLGFAAAIVVFNLPNLSSSFWRTTIHTPAFFRDGIYQHYLEKGQTVVILPYAEKGEAMLWQAQTHMYFNMAEGAGAGWPDAFLRWPIAPALSDRSYVPHGVEQLKAFLAAHDVSAILVAERQLAIWRTPLSILDPAPSEVGGISLYRVTESARPDSGATLNAMRSQFDTERIAALIAIANTCLLKKGGAASLSVLKAEELQLLPQDSLIGPPPQFALGTTRISAPLAPRTTSDPNLITDPHLAYGLWLGTTPDGHVGVGEQAWYSGVAPLIEKLRGVSSGIYFPYPNKLATGAPPPDDRDGWLLITFTLEQLARANEMLSASETKESQPLTARPTD
jgi:hypothetical protein